MNWWSTVTPTTSSTGRRWTSHFGRQDIHYLLITGIVTDVCVNATLMSAASRNYRVTAVTDGVATLWPELQQACFAIWKRKFARLRTTDEVVKELNAL